MNQFTKKEILALALLIALALAWWFRYDTHCGGNYGVACVSYDRFTGQWIYPSEEIEKKDE